MTPLADQESLSREERLRRIGALIAMALALSSLQRSQTSLVPFSERENGLLERKEQALLQRFKDLGEFAPHEAAAFWGVSRPTAYRRLRRLEQAGWIERHGKTNAVRYRLIFEKLGPMAASERTIAPQQKQGPSLAKSDKHQGTP